MIDILSELTPSQRDAVTTVEGPLLVVAGAGSGKTRVITRRVAYLASMGVPPWKILAITFTNKAADEMRGRIEQMMDIHGSWIMTFHSLCARMLRQFNELLGFQHPFTIYDETDSIHAVKAALRELHMTDSKIKPKSFRSIISSYKNQMVTPLELEGHAKNPKEFEAAKVYKAYASILQTNNALDFDDLLLRTAQLFESNEQFRTYWQNKFQFILIDEYQDTNRPQYIIARQIAAVHKNICATGDPDQSIYGWRGADINNILDFQKDYPDAKVVKLEENFRSTKKILAAAAGVIKQNRERIAHELYTNNEDGDRVKVVGSMSDINEGDAIVDEIRECASAGHKPGEMAIFYRTHAQSRVIEDSLRDAGIPYQILDAVEFYNRKEIKDVIAYLRTIENPADGVSLLRIINEPRRGIGERSMEEVIAYAAQNGISPGEAIHRVDDIPSIKPGTAAKIKAFAEMMERLRALPRRPVAELVKAVIEATLFIQTLQKSGTEEDIARAQNVGELVNAAASFDNDYPESALQQFLERVSLISDTDKIQGGDGAVLMMTLHSAKGLEFNCVYIAGVQEGLLPHENSYGSRHQTEEERRLFYVGITRAKKRLHLHWSMERMTFGQIVMGAPSRFLSEIPESAKETAGLAGHRYTSEAFAPAFVPPQRYERPEKPERPKLPAEEGERVIEYDSDVVQYGESELRPRMKVRHPRFGAGVIVEISGSGASATAIVNFGGKRRHLMLQYANLTPID